MAGASVAVHACGIPWQQRYAKLFLEGFTRLGMHPFVTNSKHDVDADIAVVLGPNAWIRVQDQRNIIGKPYLMVNRCFYGEYNDNVAIGWNGMNNRGDYCTTGVEYTDQMALRKDGVFPYQREHWVPTDGGILLCGQHSAHSTRFGSVQQYYDYAMDQARTHFPGSNVYFRAHPTESIAPYKLQPPPRTTTNRRPVIFQAITLNSTVAVELVVEGIPVCALDEGNPVLSIASHSVEEVLIPAHQEVQALLTRLAWSQWHVSEIKQGLFWQLLQRGPANRPHKGFRS